MRGGIATCGETNRPKGVETQEGGEPPKVGLPDLCAVDATLEPGLEVSNSKHLDAGCWAIDTGNANAWAGCFEFLERSTAHIVLFQECKLAAGDSVCAAEQRARNLKWNTCIAPCAVSVVGGRSAGVAVATRSHIGMTIPIETSLTSVDVALPPERFMMRLVGGYLSWGDLCWVNLSSYYCWCYCTLQ